MSIKYGYGRDSEGTLAFSKYTLENALRIEDRIIGGYVAGTESVYLTAATFAFTTAVVDKESVLIPLSDIEVSEIVNWPTGNSILIKGGTYPNTNLIPDYSNTGEVAGTATPCVHIYRQPTNYFRGPVIPSIYTSSSGPSEYKLFNTYKWLFLATSEGVYSGYRTVNGFAICSYDFQYLFHVILEGYNGIDSHDGYILSNTEYMQSIVFLELAQKIFDSVDYPLENIKLEYLGKYILFNNAPLNKNWPFTDAPIYVELSENSTSIFDTDPYNAGGVSSSAGGQGNFGKNETSDSIDIPSGSVAGDATSTGLLTRYLVNSSYLDAIGDWLWSTDLGLQIAKTVISAIYGNPSESVISLMSYPFNISTLSGVTSRNQNLVWGNHDSGIGAIALTSQAATVDWGTITLEEYWGNFLDYEPHTKIELYLPWGTGFVSIDPNMCLPGSIRVVTNIDFSKGSCIHNVIGNNNVVIGTYAGQCSQQIPIMSNDYASKMAGVVVSATALAVAGAAGGAATSAGITAANSAYNLERSTSMPHSERVAMQTSAMQTAEAPHRAIQKTAARLAASSSVAAFKRSGIISRNGSFTDGSAALGVQYPYIILSRPSQSVPEQYGSHYGYPSNIYTRLNNVRGYTEVGEIHLDGIAGTDAEIAELDSILKGGVIF